MGDKSGHEGKKEYPQVRPPFHRRFNIDVSLEEAQEKFINRVLNDLNLQFPQLEDWGEDSYDYSNWTRINPYVISKLGKRFDEYSFLAYADTDDFFKFLKALEALYEAFVVEYNDDRYRRLDRIIVSAVTSSEINLGIQWKDGLFWPSGAKLLDEELVDEPMKWLDDPKYNNVLEPFQKGLRYRMEVTKDASKLADTVIAMYQALEAMAKVVTGRHRKDLSANAELFVNKLGLSEYYSDMLKDYIAYANNEYRHAPEPNRVRKPPNPHEVEAFIYTTGLFIRLAVKQLGEE